MTTKTRSLVTAALFTALLVVFSQITIPLPFSPVPLSLALLAVFLMGGLLPPKWAGGAALTYLVMGIIGLPVFAGFLAGPGRIFGPTGGYLVAYPIMAFLIAFGSRKQKHPRFLSMAGWMILSLVVCYSLGTLWMMAYTGKDAVAVLGLAVFPFIPLDLCKAAAASAAAVTLRQQLPFFAANPS